MGTRLRHGFGAKRTPHCNFPLKDSVLTRSSVTDTIPVVPGWKQCECFRMLHYLFYSHQVVGFTSSGSYSYQLKKSICFAYLPPSLTEPGSRVEVEMLGNKFPAVVVQQPLFEPEPIRAKS